MLRKVVVEEIGRLLVEGQLSQRMIALQIGVSRGTVGAVANGRRGVHGHEPENADATLPSMGIPAERCCGCGGKVHKPCLLCQTRAFRLRKKRMWEFSLAGDSCGRRVA